ncbi:MAG: hypothetical protein M1549_03255 [Candidatus Dependentiae bacterium]|nr:hypothetical protein [Candidatus Dependentiae bacterium]
MHLKHILVALSAVFAVGLQADSCSDCSGAPISELHTLVKASAERRVHMVTELLNKRELSDERIAAMLEVEVSSVTQARIAPVELEVQVLIDTAIAGYHRCHDPAEKDDESKAALRRTNVVLQNILGFVVPVGLGCAALAALFGCQLIMQQERNRMLRVEGRCERLSDRLEMCERFLKWRTKPFWWWRSWR